LTADDGITYGSAGDGARAWRRQNINGSIAAAPAQKIISGGKARGVAPWRRQNTLDNVVAKISENSGISAGAAAISAAQAAAAQRNAAAAWRSLADVGRWPQAAGISASKRRKQHRA